MSDATWQPDDARWRFAAADSGGAGTSNKAIRERTLMRPEDVLTWLRAAPFRPFRVTLESGRSFDIRHPEMMKGGQDVGARLLL